MIEAVGATVRDTPEEVARLNAWTRSLAVREVPSDQRALVDELRALEE